MKINWIPADGSTPKETRRLIKKEYTFRKRMLKYILSDMVFDDCGENYDCLIFDLDTKSASLIYNAFLI